MHLDPIAPMRAVSVSDPALDTDSMGDSLAEYAKTRDPELLKFKLGKKPAWFVVRGMTVSYLLEVVDSGKGRTRAALAFLACVHEIELPDGTPLKPPKIDTGAYKQPIAPEEWLDIVARKLGVDAITEMGTLAIKRAQLPEDARGPFV